MSVFFEQVNQPTPNAFQKRQTILTNLLDELLRPKDQQIIEAFMKPSPDELIEQQKIGGQRIPIVMKKVESKKREEDEALEFPEPREIKPKVKKVDPNLRGPINSGMGVPAEGEQRVPIIWKKNDWGNKKGREENKEVGNQAQTSQNDSEQRVPIVYKGNKGNQKQQHWNKDKGKHNEHEEEKQEISISQAQTSQNEPEQRVPIVYKGNKGNQKQQQHWNKDKGKHNEHKQSEIGKKEEQEEVNKDISKQNPKKTNKEKGWQKSHENDAEENKEKQKYRKKK